MSLNILIEFFHESIQSWLVMVKPQLLHALNHVLIFNCYSLLVVDIINNIACDETNELCESNLNKFYGSLIDFNLRLQLLQGWELAEGMFFLKS